jgi:hypothetical protein
LKSKGLESPAQLSIKLRSAALNVIPDSQLFISDDNAEIVTLKKAPVRRNFYDGRLKKDT